MVYEAATLACLRTGGWPRLLCTLWLLTLPLQLQAQCLQPAQRYITGALPRFLAVGDMNKDGRLDIVTASDNSGTVTVLLAEPSGGYTGQDYAVGRPGSVAVGDVNKDGRLDIVTTTSSNVTTLLAQSTGYALQNYNVGYTPSDVALGDVNKDGLLDIVTTNANGNSVTVLLAQSTGGYTRQDYNLGTIPLAVALGDVNADGRLDIVTANFQNNVTILTSEPTGSYAPLSTIL
ncbi:FG-GAP repeat domain-containing protein [Spirosoma knui]